MNMFLFVEKQKVNKASTVILFVYYFPERICTSLILINSLLMQSTTYKIPLSIELKKILKTKSFFLCV